MKCKTVYRCHMGGLLISYGRNVGFMGTHTVVNKDRTFNVSGVNVRCERTVRVETIWQP